MSWSEAAGSVESTRHSSTRAVAPFSHANPIGMSGFSLSTGAGGFRYQFSKTQRKNRHRNPDDPAGYFVGLEAYEKNLEISGAALKGRGFRRAVPRLQRLKGTAK